MIEVYDEGALNKGCDDSMAYRGTFKTFIEAEDWTSDNIALFEGKPVFRMILSDAQRE